jgi:glycosyltransferase involved in cell wall biosynthesis
MTAARLLVVTSTFPRWEDDTEPSFVFDLCRFLSEQGMEVDVLAPHAKGAKIQETMSGINVHRYRYCLESLQTLTYQGGILANLKKNPLKLILVPFLLSTLIWVIYRKTRSTQYDVIHAHWLIPQGIACAVAGLIPGNHLPDIVCTSHGGDLYALNSFVFRSLKRWTISRTRAFCVVSHDMKKKVMQMGMSEDQIHIMPMGVDLQHKFVPVDDVERLDNRLIFVGRLVEKKGVGVLLEAMQLLIKKYHDLELMIAGDGPLSSSLKQFASDAGLDDRVRFLGSQPHHELPRLYSSAGIAVVPSVVAGSGDQEGLGLVTIEALGCGCAVVVSALEAIRDVVNRDTGILVQPGDAGDLARGISFLLDNLGSREELSKRGRDEVIRRFDWQVSGDRYLRLLQGLVSGAPAGR